jgi:hypothetical protein
MKNLPNVLIVDDSEENVFFRDFHFHLHPLHVAMHPSDSYSKINAFQSNFSLCPPCLRERIGR